jgi:enediyne biosynthesis protein E4
MSQPDGTYRVQPLPTTVQISPIQAMAAADFDGDRAIDVFAVQNSYAAVPSVGQFDGGLGVLLRGDGRGGFDAMSPAECGAIVPGDARDVVAWDFDHDGRPDLFVTRNNGTTLAFRNTGGELASAAERVR